MHHDVLVIGSGPAGASAAFFLQHLSEGGLDIALLERLDERKQVLYHRMCGEGVSRRTFRKIAPLEPSDVTNVITRAVEHWPGREPMELKVKGYILDRPAFLKRIRERFRSLGGENLTGTACEIETNGPGFRVRLKSGETIECDHLVGADGAHSLVRRALFKEEPKELILADQYILDQKPLADAIHFYYAAQFNGAYRWEFPAGERTKIGFPRGTDSPPEDAVEVHRRAIPIGGLSHIVTGNACLVGDAAAQVNAITFGGIRTSLMAGKMAAEAIVSGDPLRYQRRWSSSPYQDPIYLTAMHELRGMTNSELERSVSATGDNVSPLSWIVSYLRFKEYRGLLNAYRLADAYGW